MCTSARLCARVCVCVYVCVSVAYLQFSSNSLTLAIWRERNYRFRGDLGGKHKDATDTC